jgi:hypothetical protein
LGSCLRRHGSKHPPWRAPVFLEFFFQVTFFVIALF